MLALNYLTLTNTTPQKITFSFRRPIEKLIFAETIKIVTKLLKQTFNTQMKFKELEIMH